MLHACTIHIFILLILCMPVIWAPDLTFLWWIYIYIYINAHMCFGMKLLDSRFRHLWCCSLHFPIAHIASFFLSLSLFVIYHPFTHTFMHIKENLKWEFISGISSANWLKIFGILKWELHTKNSRDCCSFFPWFLLQFFECRENLYPAQIEWEPVKKQYAHGKWIFWPLKIGP